MKSIILFIVFLFYFESCGSIYQVEVLRKHEHYVVGYYDFHDRIMHKNQQQRAYFEKLFAVCDSRAVRLFVEDLSSINHRGIFGCGLHSFDSRGGLLGGIAQLAHDAGIPTENHEYRYCRAAAFGYAFNQLRTGHQTVLMIPPIAMKQLVEEVGFELQDLQSETNEHELLGLSVNALDKTIKESIKEYEWDIAYESMVSDYANTRYSRLTARDMEQFLTFDSGILDLKIARSVVKHKDSHALVIAGGTHVENSFKLLKRMGYKSVFSVRTSDLHHKKLDSILRKCMIVQ